MAMFRLNSGVHSEGVDEKGVPIWYKAKDEFESKSNLLLKNTPGMPPRYELVSGDVSEYDSETGRLPEEAPVKKDEQPEENLADTPLEEMTVKQLLTVAKANGVELGEAKKKEEIIAALQG